MLNIKQGICINGFIAKQVCINPRCERLAFICSDENCDCNIIHQNCLKHDMKSILDQISLKLNRTVGPLEDLVLFYDQMLKMILIQKNELLSKLDVIYEMIYEQQQSKFIEAIQKKTLFTGQQVQKVLDQLNKENNMEYFQEQLSAQTYKTKKMIEQGLIHLKRKWRKKKKINQEQTKIKLRQCQVRYIYLNGKWNKPLQISSSFKQLPMSVVQGYDLDRIDSLTVQGLAYHCPKLHRLEIGVASSFTNSDDSSCQMIADELRQLRILKIQHSPNITDQGAIAIAGKLDSLEELEIVDCNLSEEGKQTVRRLLNGCKKIKL